MSHFEYLKICEEKGFTPVNQAFNSMGINVSFTFFGGFQDAYAYCIEIGLKPYQIDNWFVI